MTCQSCKKARELAQQALQTTANPPSDTSVQPLFNVMTPLNQNNPTPPAPPPSNTH